MSETKRHSRSTCVRLAATLAPLLLLLGVARPASTQETTQHPILVPEVGHTGGVSSVAVEQSGRFVATGGTDRTVKLWNADSGGLIRTYGGTSSLIGSIAFEPGSSQSLYSLDSNGEFQRWNLASGDVSPLHENPPGEMKFQQLQSDGYFVGIGPGSSGPLLMVIPLGAPVRRSWMLPVPSDQILGAYDPSRGLAATTNDEGLVQLWKRGSSRSQSLAEKIPGALFLEFSPDGDLLVGSDEQQSVTVWDVSSPKLLFSRSCPELVGYATDPYNVCRTKFIPGQNKLAIGFKDRIAILDSRTGQAIDRKSIQGDVGEMAASFDGKQLFVLIGAGFVRLSLESAETISSKSTLLTTVTSVAFTPDDERLVTAGMRSGDSMVSWALKKGRPSSLAPNPPGLEATAVSADGSYLARMLVDDTEASLELWNGREEIRKLDTHGLPPPTAVAVTVDGQRIAIGGGDYRIPENDLWLVTGDSHRPLGKSEANFWSLQFNPSGTLLVSASGLPTSSKGSLKVWGISDATRNKTLLGPDEPTNAVNFSVDGTLLASSGQTIHIWDAASFAPLQSFSVPATFTAALAFRGPNNAELITGSVDGAVRIWDWKSKRMKASFPAHTSQIYAISVSSGGEFLATGAEDGSLKLWRIETLQTREPGKNVAVELATLSAQPDGNWLVVAPDGRFDTNNLDRVKSMHWIFGDEPFHPLPPEIFFREFYLPNLLSRLLDPRFSPPPAATRFGSINRVQPSVQIRDLSFDSESRAANVLVDVSNVASQAQKDKEGKFLESGVYDVRLFRDNQMVAEWPEPSPGSIEKTGPIVSEQDLQTWRRQHQVKLDPKGNATITFHNIRLPQRSSLDHVQFTAYAFNSDRVKSLTTPARLFALPPSSQPVSRTAFVLSMGVNANQSRNLDLDFAVSSAERARALLRSKLEPDYQQIVEIPLYSDRDSSSAQIKSKTATKADLQAVLDLLAGRPVPATLREEVDPRHQLRRATPDDAVVLFVASHGYVDPQGVFYLMPYDTGTQNWGVTPDILTHCLTSADQSDPCKQAHDLLQHSVSSGDLTAWWNGVDAGRMVMILDTCHSGAVPGEEFRPAPLGDPGFGQLSYDKGMIILTASQPTQTERGELVTGGEGRTLLVEALDTAAQANPKQSLERWLHESEQQLPKLAKSLYPQLADQNLQHPSLLDFSSKGNTATVLGQDKPQR
jgi:WD40 repeat protein